MNKSELLTLMNGQYAEFEKALAPLDETRLTTPGANGDWSIKDIVAHIATWQNHLLYRMRAALADETPAMVGHISDEDIDSMNARFFTENQARSSADVLADLRSSYHAIVELVQSMSEADLFDPQRFAWMNGNTLVELVAGDTYEHYDEHMPSIVGS